MVVSARADLSRDYTVQASVAIEEQPLRLVFSWPAHGESLSYEVYRKHKDAPSWGVPRALLPGEASSYTDTDVERGRAYEYRFVRRAQHDTTTYEGYGYVYAGIAVPPVEYRGKLILLTEQAIEQELAPDIARLESDLRGDGWLVVRRSVARAEKPPVVRKLIADIYRADTVNVKAVFLLGHIPVPYSGNYLPDGHPDHKGAWPADVYYADVDGVWTDETVNNDTTPGQRPENMNIPGDGKFDQNILPSDAELIIGRVDLSNLPMFAKSEVQLLRRYLDKNHAYRHNLIPDMQRRGLIDDNFKEGVVEGFASNGWRNFSAMFGAANVDTGEFIRGFSPAGDVALTDSSYLWSYGCGSGNFISAAFVAHGTQLAADTIELKTVFTMLFGSYFGDWDSQDNFMRLALASQGSVLTSCWAGRPFWHVHHMALGETIGYGTRLSQNNDTMYLSNPAFPVVARMVHTALMGDPTLRLHMGPPATQLLASVNAERRAVELQWQPSSSGIGYYVYRAASPEEPFQRLNSDPIGATTFIDLAPVAGRDVRYMVRAVRLEVSASGSYYALSSGTEAAVEVERIFADGGEMVVYPNPAQGAWTVEIMRRSAKTIGIELYDVAGRRVLHTEHTADGDIAKVQVRAESLAPGTYLMRVQRMGEVIEQQVLVR